MRTATLKPLGIGLAIVVFMTAMLALHIYVLPAQLNMPLLFTLPVLLAAYSFGPRIASLFGALALVEISYHSWLEATPAFVWAADVATLGLIAGLGIWIAEESRRRADLAAENAALAEARAHEAQRMRVLAEAGQLFGSSLDISRVLDDVVSKSTEVLGDFAVLFLLKDDDNILYPRAIYAKVPDLRRRLTDALEAAPLVRGRGVAGLVAETGRSMLIADVAKADLAPEVRFLLDTFAVRSFIAVPLRVRDRVVGVLVAGCSERSRRFGEPDLHLAEDLAALAAVSIHNARLYAHQDRLVHELNEERCRRERFLGMVTHEIAGVLTVLHGYGQLLARPQERHAAASDRAMTLIPAQTRRLLRLVTDLQDISRIERGKFEIRRQDCDLVPLARGVVEEQQNAARSHHIGFSSDGDSLPGYWDPDRLVQVLSNLLRNAVNYSPNGGDISVAVRRNRDSAEIAVRDHGIGISGEDLPRLFKPYTRLERGGASGTGLGLYIAKAIVEAHGGRIEVQSAVDRGSTFSLILPLPRDEAHQAA